LPANLLLGVALTSHNGLLSTKAVVNRFEFVPAVGLESFPPSKPRDQYRGEYHTASERQRIVAPSLPVAQKWDSYRGRDGPGLNAFPDSAVDSGNYSVMVANSVGTSVSVPASLLVDTWDLKMADCPGWPDYHTDG